MIAIIGAGAMGGMLAAKLSSAGRDTLLVDVSEALVNEINTNGMQVETKTDLQTVKLKATTNPEGSGTADIVFFFVKAQHTLSAAKLAKPLVGPSTAVVTLQNGWGNADVLSEVFPVEQLIVGVTYHSATVVKLGKVGHTGVGVTFIGPYQDGASIGLTERVGTVLKEAGMENTVTPLVKTEVWKKLILNAATLPTAALTGLCAGDVADTGPLLKLVDEIAAEAVQVARAQGYQIELEERIDRIHAVLQGAGKGKASMLQDVLGKRKTEIEVVNGAVVKAAEKAGIPVNMNKAMVALIGGLERSWTQQ